MMDDKLPFSRALLWILLPTLLVSGSALMGWLYFQSVRERRLHDDQYRIVAILQSTPQVEALRTVYLAELLNLSFDRPINLYQFNTKEAVQTLLKHPLIKQAEIKKILPGTLYIHYQTRIPLVYLSDYSNTAIDEEGYLFPHQPFFTPKHLPKLYLGLEKEGCSWGTCLKEVSTLQFAFRVLESFNQILEKSFYLKQLDVSQAQADSYGQRQIVLMLEPRVESEISFLKSIYLRLSSDHYAQDLANFLHLFSDFLDKRKWINKKDQELTIDLRIAHLAFIKFSPEAEFKDRL